MKYPARRSCLDLIKPYVPGKPVEEVERELGLTDVIKLASNENPLGPSPLAVKALENTWRRLHHYPDGNCFYLKEALAAKLQLDPEQLLFGNGSDEILGLLCQTYINPGDEGLTVQPTFSEYEFALRVMGGKPRYVPLQGKDFAFDPEVLAAALNERTRLIFLSNPNNPTGSMLSRGDLEILCERLPGGVLVVLDEAYYEFARDPEYPDSVELLRQGYPVVVLRTFSKVYGLAGLRIGYGAAPVPVAADLHRAREPFNVNTAAQVAARAALEDRDHVERSLQLVLEGRQQIQSGLAQLGLQAVPTQANFYFVDLKRDCQAVFKRLLHRGVIVRTGDIFGFPTYIRVSYGTAAQNDRFLEALSAVLAELPAIGGEIAGK